MRTQYVKNGVLVRPLEKPATNFLSTRFYDGRGVVDVLGSRDAAQVWMRTLSEEIRFPRSPFIPTDDQLGWLRQLRYTIESVYRNTIDGELAPASAHLQGVLDRVRIRPGIVSGKDYLHASWGDPSGNPFDELTAEIAVSAMVAVTGFPATLLRRCEAPRCVLYFTRYNPRQHWCSDICGNRVRVARSTRTDRTTGTGNVS
ncbi:CGNR zinc finger domain-containing protein [Rhodococcus pyridinivorans]|uniref:CGNR zinc finger domain-containing protein n=2 Tax=Rhodococcus TaxID=1827 RepID=UPI0020CC3D44|nr:MULTISPECIES: CGNR zinc finger domain-containing protein [Rhodococcus]UVT25952.1 CGNR zinc finger domain-containing protein [Rhodococcus pyridinivorans]